MGGSALKHNLVIFLLSLSILWVFAGCAKTPASKDVATHGGQSDTALADVKLTRTNYDLGQKLMLDVSPSGCGFLCQQQAQYYIVTVDETTSITSEIPCAFPEGFSPQRIEEGAENYYVAGRSEQEVAVYEVTKNGDVSLVVSTPAESAVLDFVQAKPENFFLICGDIVDVALFDTSYVENTTILCLDQQGQLTAIPLETPTETLFALHKSSDGTILAFSNRSTTEEQQVRVYAIREGQLDPLDIISLGHATMLTSGSSDTVYLSTATDLYLYEINGQILNRTAKWANYGVNGNKVLGGSILSAECVLLWSKDQVWKLQPCDPNLDTITLRVAVIEPFELPVQELLDFQSSYPEYQVETVSFQDQGELNLALAAGEPLDLIQVDELDPTRYFYNGVFLDLSSYLQNDTDFSQGDFYATLWEMTRIEGKLPVLMTNFTIQGLYGPKENYGDKSALSLEEFQQITMDSRFYETTVCENAITWLCSVAGFDSDGSITQEGLEDLSDLITLAAQFQRTFETVDYNIPGDALPLNWLNGSSSMSIRQLAYQEQRLWNTEGLCFLGYPSTDGLSFTQSRSYGICTKSEHPDAAWAFIRYLLLSGNEDVGISMLRPSDLPLLDQLVSQINNQALNYASPILSIIQEEASSCFSGNRKPEDVVPIIANRVSIYLAEQQP